MAKTHLREVLEAIGASREGITDDKDAVGLLALHLKAVQACQHTDELEDLSSVRDGALRALDATAALRATSSVAQSHAELLIEALKPVERLISRMEKEAPPMPKAKPSTLSRVREPVEQDVARSFLAKVDPAEGQDVLMTASANLLDDMKKQLKATQRLLRVPDAEALAQAMSRESTEGQTVEQARQLIANNQGRGFTGASGTVYVLDNVPETEHDEVHESVHLMSAPGGKTKIMAEYGEQLNEGFTEYFTKQMCARLGVPDATAYPEHVAFMQRLEPVVGHDMLYTAYMKNGGMDPIIEALTDKWLQKDDELFNGGIKTKPHAPPRQRNGTAGDRALSLVAMKKKFGTFPPPSLNFWNLVFFA